VNFADAVRSALTQYARFSGRARRSEYWFFVLFNVIVSVVASILDKVVGSDFGAGTGIVSTVLGLALLLPSIAVFWRRMHDTGRSGAWFLLGLIPLVGAIILIVWECQDSNPGTNRFGPSPKGELAAPGYPQAPTGPTWS
jgi:uncharacterized membrane protein YhaH (DUF805 family)